MSKTTFNMPPQELEMLQQDLIQCRENILFMEETLQQLNETLSADDARRNLLLHLLKRITEKRQQLRVIEDMLLRQSLVAQQRMSDNTSTTHLLRKAIDIRLHTHREEIRQTTDDCYHLFSSTQAA